MAYVKRDPSGKITAVSFEQNDGNGHGWERIKDNDPELAQFGSKLAPGKNEMETSDLGLIRVLEDLVTLLVDNGTIRFTDFPAAAQTKLLSRRDKRAMLNQAEQAMLVDDSNETI